MELVPKLPFAAVASSAAVFLKGTLAFRHEDARRGAKSRLRIEEGAGLHDPAYVKLLRTGLNGRPFRRPFAHPASSKSPQVLWLSRLERKGPEVTVDGVSTVCVASPGKI